MHDRDEVAIATQHDGIAIAGTELGLPPLSFFSVSVRDDHAPNIDRLPLPCTIAAIP